MPSGCAAIHVGAWAVLISFLPLACALSDPEYRPSQNDPETDGGRLDTDDPEVPWNPLGCVSMDFLFIVDNSGSMSEEQQNLVDNFPRFMGVLEDYSNDATDSLTFRIGVITTDQSTPEGAVLVGQEECDLGEEPWLDGPCEDREDKFTCMAKVGNEGFGAEMPFVAACKSLGSFSEEGWPNHGFYPSTEDSLLVIVIITDEDDNSYLSPKDVHEFLTELSGGWDRFVVVGIAGPEPCESGFGNADEAVKIKELVELCGERGFFGSICHGDLWVPLEEAAAKIQEACSELL